MILVAVLVSFCHSVNDGAALSSIGWVNDGSAGMPTSYGLTNVVSVT